MDEPGDGKRAIIPFHAYPTADDGMAWDAGVEVKKADVKDLKKMCAISCPTIRLAVFKPCITGCGGPWGRCSGPGAVWTSRPATDSHGTCTSLVGLPLVVLS